MLIVMNPKKNKQEGKGRDPKCVILKSNKAKSDVLLRCCYNKNAFTACSLPFCFSIILQQTTLINNNAKGKREQD